MPCSSDGKPEPVIRWYRDNRPLLMADSRITMVASGSLKISDLRVQDSAKYTCKAVSETGETTWEAFLLVTSESTPNFPVRSSSVSFLPDAPSKPVVSDVTDTTAHLSWTPGTKSQQRPVLKFYVEYYGFDTTESWVTASRDVVTDSFTVHQLRPNSSYTFLVRAVNSEGVGFPSQPSEPIRTLGFAVDTDQNTDCSSVNSSSGGSGSGDSTFLTEEDFASAIARAAELSGLTVVGTTVSDPGQKSKKERRQRRPARPISPGYSTDSNYGSIDMVRKPYPKSQRKQQIIEQGKSRASPQQNDVQDKAGKLPNTSIGGLK